jgi:hypothetical protein
MAELTSHEIAMKVADACAIAHFFIANTILLVGEYTDLLKHLTPAPHPGFLLITKYLDAFVYPYFKDYVFQVIDTITFYSVAQLIIIGSSILYGFIVYVFTRLIVSAFR